MALHKYTLQEGLNLELGQGGYDYVAPSGDSETISDHTYIAITALTASGGTVTVITSSDTDIWDTTAVNLPVGVTIYGRWDSVIIADGDIAIVYRG